MRTTISNLNIDVSVVIPIIEEAVQQQHLKLEANILINNEHEYLRTLKGIADIKILLSLLRTCELRPK